MELATRRRDERMAQVAEDLGAKRKESLMDIHQKKVKKAKVSNFNRIVIVPFYRILVVYYSFYSNFRLNRRSRFQE